MSDIYWSQKFEIYYDLKEIKSLTEKMDKIDKNKRKIRVFPYSDRYKR